MVHLPCRLACQCLCMHGHGIWQVKNYVYYTRCAESTTVFTPSESSTSDSTSRATRGAYVKKRSIQNGTNRSSNNSQRSSSGKGVSISKKSSKAASTMPEVCYIVACMLVARVWGNDPVLPIGTLPGANGCAASVETRNLCREAAQTRHNRRK